jgi:hypothetical protein
VSGPRQIVRTGGGIDGHLNSTSAVEGGDARGNTRARVDGFAEGGTKLRGVLRGHGLDAQVFQPLLSHGQADQPAPMARHEIDRLGRGLFRRDT